MRSNGRDFKLKGYWSELKGVPAYFGQIYKSFSKPRKLLFWILLLGMLTPAAMRAFSLSYDSGKTDGRTEFGVTFSAARARELGVDPKKNLEALLSGLKFKKLRLVSYWNEHEKAQGEYDFSDLDWQFDLANKYGAEVSLAIGLRQPRWPECHEPEWARSLKKESGAEAWRSKLNDYIKATVDRYNSNSALGSWQLENEFFLSAFGECEDFDRSRLKSEFGLVKSISSKPIILSRSNNYGGWALGDPQADIYGISVYRKVHNQTLGYVEYPFPAWYYTFLAAGQEKINGKKSIVHEFQLEPWIKSGSLEDSSVEEQNKTMSREDIKLNLEFAKKINIKDVYLWGGEWWYARAQNGDSSIWEAVQSGV